MFIKAVKKRLVFMLFLFCPLLAAHAWFVAQVYYSDFQWLDNERLLVLHIIADDGAAGSFFEIRILNLWDGSYLPLTPFIRGFACSLAEHTGYVIRISANRKYDLARNETEALKAFHSCIAYEYGYYEVFKSFFDFEKQAQRELAGLRERGYDKAFILSRQAYETRKAYSGRTVSLMIDRSNIWYKKVDDGYNPVFYLAANIAPIAVYGDLFLFLENNSLYTFDLKSMTVHRLSMCLHERMNYGVYQMVPFWDAASGSVIFPHVKESGRSYWRLKANGGGLTQSSQESTEYGRYKNARHMFSLEQLDKSASEYQIKWKQKGEREIPGFGLSFPGKAGLIIRFYFCDCCWANSLLIKNAGGERVLLPSARNW